LYSNGHSNQKLSHKSSYHDSSHELALNDDQDTSPQEGTNKPPKQDPKDTDNNKDNDSNKDDDKDSDDDKKKDSEPKTIKAGNLALSASQQPGPLISFGENVVDKGTLQFEFFGDYYFGHNKHMIDAVPSILYGITDDLSIFYNVPVAVSYKDGPDKSAGLEDIFVQLEYAFYDKEEETYVQSATVVAYFSYPTGSATKTPPTGFGTPSFFFGTTWNHTEIDWFAFTSYGGTIGGTRQGTRIGNIYLYEFGYGRNIYNIVDCTDETEWIFAWMIEVDGVFSERNRIHNVTNPDSGGNVIYVTPSLWLSSKHWIIQVGCGFVAYQHLNGSQNKNHGLAAIEIEYTW
jgi:hypothetical protein